MIHLSNGAKVHAAYIVPQARGLKDRGCVLAETETDWVVWNIYWDGETVEDYPDNSILHEVWEAENGNYIQKGSFPDAQELAELSFGRRIRQFLTMPIHDGVRT